MISLIQNTRTNAPRGFLRGRRKSAGIALIEILVSVLILGIGVVSGISALTSGNRKAETNRIRNAAIALCQERIDQVVTAPFSPPGTMPSSFGTAWPAPATDTVTSTETVQLCTDAGGGSTLSGTRITLVSLANATLNLVRVTARVTYTYRGTNYVCETYSLRSPD